MRHLNRFLVTTCVLFSTNLLAAEPKIEVLYPNGGENFKLSSPRFTIRWNSEGVGDFVSIRILGGEGGRGGFTIAKRTENDGEYEFKLPSSWGYRKFKVRVSSLDGRVSDLSDGHFHRKQFVGRPDPNYAKRLVHWHDKIVFLGDSNTYSGRFIAIMEAAIRQARVPRGVELINLGLGDETVSGLSEPHRTVPRPCVLDRLDTILAKSKPNVVVACYGMNDAIYHPFAAGRFGRFKSGMKKLVAKVKATGAKLVVVTPPPFDSVALSKSGRLQEASAPRFGRSTPYAGYNDVLRKYAEWELSLTDADLVIDFNTGMNVVMEHYRLRDPNYSWAEDGVQFGEQGHQELAYQLLRGLDLEIRRPDRTEVELSVQRQELLRDAWLSHIGHSGPDVKRGLPLGVARFRAEALLNARPEN